MATFSPVLWSQGGKDGNLPIKFRLHIGNKSKYFATDYVCKPEQWSKETRLLITTLPKKEKHPQAAYINSFLQDQVEDAVAIITRLQTKQALTLERFAEEFLSKDKKVEVNPPPDHRTNVGAYFTRREAELKSEGRIEYGNTHRYVRNSLLRFHFKIKKDIAADFNKDFSFTQIDVSFLETYLRWLRTSSCTDRTIRTYLCTLRTVFKQAMRNGVETGEYPFNEFQFEKRLNLRTRKRALPKQQMLAFIKYDAASLPLSERIFYEMFVFSYMCNGMNFVDMAYLQWKDISDGHLIYSRKKNERRQHADNTIIVQLYEEVQRVLSLFQESAFAGNGGYVFPIIDPEIHKTPAQVADRIKSTRRRYNAANQRIAKAVGITTKLTSYVTRHTFASVLFQGGLPISQIRPAMGHASETTTQIYIDDVSALRHDEIYNALL